MDRIHGPLLSQEAQVAVFMELVCLACYQGDVYAIASGSRNITAFLLASGGVDWTQTLFGQIDTIPTIGNNVLVVGYSDIDQVTAN